MNKRGSNYRIYNVAIMQMFLLFLSLFAFSFFISEIELASALDATPVGDPKFGGGVGLTNEPPPSVTTTAAKTTTETAAAESRGIFDIIGDIYGGDAFAVEAGAEGGFTSGLNSIIGGAAWGFTVYFGVKMIGKLFGLDKPLVDSLSAAAGLGVGAGVTASYLVSNGVLGSTVAGAPQIWGMSANAFGAVVGIGVGVAVLLLTYKKEKREVISFECLPWEPPLGGEKCDQCNDPIKPCTEYRCKSLGQGCEIINQGTEQEMCFWKNKGDTRAPKINTDKNKFKPQGLEFRPDAAISMPNTGFKIIDPKANNGCIEAFTKLEFGITTNEPAQCRIDYELTKTYDEMAYLFGESNYFDYNHTQQLKIPDPANTVGVPILYTKKNGVNTMTLYARCIDGNGNGGNSGAVAFSFCVKEGPDTSPPVVEGGSIDSGSFVQFNADKVPYELYTNEISECKWSRLDKAFEDMENTMSCANQVEQINANLDYVCSTELTGIKNDFDNKFYFRCKDLPGKAEKDRNVMSTSFPLTLKGTKNTLAIEQVGPNGTITGGESVVGVNLVVKTSFGVEDGKAVCAYSLEENDLANYIDMDETDNYLHNQTQFLPQGSYKYFFKCVDAGGNLASASTSFIVKTDTAEPLIARIFRDGSSMKIITNEDGGCVYSLNSCSYDYESGTGFVYDTSASGGFNKKVHYTDWDTSKTYYIKCQDINGKKPRSDKCSAVIQGSEL